MGINFLAKKSLGQNFLIQPAIVADIVSVSEIKTGDLVLEIGPGTGLLTKKLLEAGAKVVAIEKDDRLINTLEKDFWEYVKNGKLKIIHEDALEIDPDEIIQGPYKVVANIPYYITGKILRLLLEQKNKPASITLLLQKEVAERIIAKDEKESLLSVSVKVFGTPIYVRTVRSGNFNPAPKVDSAVLLIKNISNNFFKNFSEKDFFVLLSTSFSAKRKKLMTNLKKTYPKESLERVFGICNIPEDIRPEKVSTEKWKCLANELLQ